jgi:hypothetical protein
MGRVVSAMQEPFSALIFLQLWHTMYEGMTSPALPDTFLGGSGPRLQVLQLVDTPFPTLPKPLLSASDLVHLSLYWIPDNGYISPEVMVTCLSMLTKLKTLTIKFKTPASRPDPRSRRPPPLTPVVLPSFTHLTFQGVSEYLEDLVAQIDAP